MGMELLASPYLAKRAGGVYTEADAARARIEHLESDILFWPYMAVVDAFQHWVYENPDAAAIAENCDDEWARQWKRFMVGIDWSGLDQEMMTGWHRKLHIHEVPFYYVEYGLAQLGAVQIWGNALRDQSRAVADYRRALALGGTVPLPVLFSIAGAKFGFDVSTLRPAVELLERVIAELEAGVDKRSPSSRTGTKKVGSASKLSKSAKRVVSHKPRVVRGKAAAPKPKNRKVKKAVAVTRKPSGRRSNSV
jgi:oligoendopeptidase F